MDSFILHSDLEILSEGMALQEIKRHACIGERPLSAESASLVMSCFSSNSHCHPHPCQQQRKTYWGWRQDGIAGSAAIQAVIVKMEEEQHCFVFSVVL